MCGYLNCIAARLPEAVKRAMEIKRGKGFYVSLLFEGEKNNNCDNQPIEIN